MSEQLRGGKGYIKVLFKQGGMLQCMLYIFFRNFLCLVLSLDNLYLVFLLLLLVYSNLDRYLYFFCICVNVLIQVNKNN